MKIQLGKIYLNKTIKYLVPLLKVYGDTLKANLNSLQFLAIGVGDFLCSKKLENHLFMLSNIEYPDKKTFYATLEWLRLQDYYEDDYAYDDIVKGKQHMIVLKLPKQGIDSFFAGKYSSLFEEEELKLLNNDVLSIVIKDHNYIYDFIKNIEEEFGTKLLFDEVGDRELDRNPFKNQEIFNYE